MSKMENLKLKMVLVKNSAIFSGSRNNIVYTQNLNNEASKKNLKKNWLWCIFVV